MASVQERLKLKRAQIDTWYVREKLCLASSVLRSGDQNWMSVSRSLRAFGDSGRPADWFSQKSCAVQYSTLLENVETPKRKKRTGDKVDSVETPSESIVRRLTQERIDELKRLMHEHQLKYRELKEKVMQVKSGHADDRLDTMLTEIDEEKRRKVKKAEAHEQWLREREEKKIELERAWKPPVAPASPHRRKHPRNVMRRNSSQSEPSSEADSALDSPLSEPLNVDIIGDESTPETTTVEPKPAPTPTSPLLTSLLKSPSPAPNVQSSSILHSAITSNRGASPTITSLLNSAPGIPGSSNMVTVAPPTTVSPSLKNLVSSAINSEQPHHQVPLPNPSPAAGAPTLSMLLELPPSLPGKPLPELPSAIKSTTTLPPSTLSAAATPSTPIAKVITMKNTPPATITSPKKVTTAVATVSGSIEMQAGAPEVKASAPVGRTESVEMASGSASPGISKPPQVESKQDPMEVLIEEVVLNEHIEINSEIHSSQMADVVPTGQVEPMEKEKQTVGDLKFDDQVIEAPVDTQPPKPEIKNEDVITDVDDVSLTATVENTDDKSSKEESVETLVDSSTQDIATDESSTVKESPAPEVELTSEAVTEVIEIKDEQVEANQTDVVDPCLQELENMEVIILDKMQGLDEVQIVEDMKDLKVVQVMMGAEDKGTEEAKENEKERSENPEEITSVDGGETESAVESKNIEEIKKSLMETSAEVIDDVESEEVTEVSSSSSEVTKTTESNNVESATVESKDILPSVVDIETEDSEGEKVKNKESEELKEKDIEEEVSRESPLEQKAEEDNDSVEDEEKEPKSAPTKEVSKKETRESMRKEVLKDTARKDSPLKELRRKDSTAADSKKEHREESKEEGKSKEKEGKEVIKKESNKEPASIKKDSVKESVKEDVLRDVPLKKDDVPKQTSSSKDERKEVVKEKKEQNQRKEPKEVPTKETVGRNREDSKSINKDTSRKELPTREGSRKFGRELVKKDQPEKQVLKDTPREVTRRETQKKELSSKETVKETQVKEAKKDPTSKEVKQKDATSESDSNKSNPSKEVPKKDISLKEVAKETPGKKEISRRDSREERKESVRRGAAREERKESGREDLRKRSHLKEITRGMAKKSEAEKKAIDLLKAEPVVKLEKTRRESSDVAQIDSKEAKENKRERRASETKSKNDEIKIKEEEISAKDTKHTSGVPVARISKAEGENNINTDIIKREDKENTKVSDETKSQEIHESSDEKIGKRTPLRAETPSTEDDKTNDAEPPKTVGRKRLNTANIFDSVPNSPASASTTDEEKEYRAWKKSIMLLYGRLATHKYASLFLRPITDEQAPGYSSVVHRPIDLLSIKKNIETGVIRTTVEFQRDVMLMFQNSIMYNKSSHFVHKMARQMQVEGMQHIQDFLSTQLLLQATGDGVPIRRETRTTEANKQREEEGENSFIIHKRKRNVGEGDRVLKKKKVDD